MRKCKLTKEEYPKGVVKRSVINKKDQDRYMPITEWAYRII